MENAHVANSNYLLANTTVAHNLTAHKLLGNHNMHIIAPVGVAGAAGVFVE